jgi:hypothetical protein
MSLEFAVRYISRAGNDTTGDGSEANPFQSVQGAVNQIADASAVKPYLIEGGPGTYPESFRLKPYMNFRGDGRSTTLISNPATNWIDPAFAAAGTQEGSIAQCGFLTDVGIDFTDDVNSTGIARFHFEDVACAGGNFNFVGNNANDRITVNDCADDTAGGVHTINVTNAIVRMDKVQSEAMALNITCNGNINANIIVDVWLGGITMTGQVDGSPNTGSAVYSAGQTGTSLPVFTGNRINYNPGKGAITLISGPDADTNYVFGAGTVVSGSKVLPTSGRITLLANISQERTYTINGAPPNSNMCELETLNGIAAPLNLKQGVGGTLHSRTIARGNSYRLQFFGGGANPLGMSKIECGFVKLTNGQSILIPADVTSVVPPLSVTPIQSTPVILTNLYDPSASTALGITIQPFGFIDNPSIDGGGFQLKALRADKSIETGDNSTYMWMLAGVLQ